MEERTLKIVLAFRSAIVRERIATLLGEVSGLEIIAQAEGAAVALQYTLQLKPDVLLLDFPFFEESVAEILDALAQIQPPTKSAGGSEAVIMVMANDSAEQLRPQLLAAGADMVLDQSYDFDKMVDFLRLLVRIIQPVPQKGIPSKKHFELDDLQSSHPLIGVES